MNAGAVYIICLGVNGTMVGPSSKIANGLGLPNGTFGANRRFGQQLTTADIDGDGRSEIVATADPPDGLTHRVLYLLWLNLDGGYLRHVVIGVGSPHGIPPDLFRWQSHNAIRGEITEVPQLRALTGDNQTRLLLGAPFYVEGGLQNTGTGVGAVVMLQVFDNGTVADAKLVTNGRNGLTEKAIVDHHEFGWASESLGDINGNMWPDVAVAGDGTESSNPIPGAVYVLELSLTGQVRELLGIIGNNVKGVFGGPFVPVASFWGRAMATVPGLLADSEYESTVTLVVGSPHDDREYVDDGSVWIFKVQTSTSTSVCASPTPIASPTSSASASPTSTATQTANPSSSASASPTSTATQTANPSSSASASPMTSPSASATSRPRADSLTVARTNATGVILLRVRAVEVPLTLGNTTTIKLLQVAAGMSMLATLGLRVEGSSTAVGAVWSGGRRSFETGAVVVSQVVRVGGVHMRLGGGLDSLGVADDSGSR